MRILIIGDESSELGSASKIAYELGATVKQLNNIDQALSLIRNGNSADLIMIDVKQDIAYLIDSLKGEHIHAPVIACGFENNKDQAVRAIRAGAKEYITLPPDEEIIISIIESICAKDDIIYESKIMSDIIKLATQAARSNANILITGDSGTGKEVMARFIHNKSTRHREKFISINCAAIPESLIESELFGHEKGAFTGAIARRIGKFEESNGGTLLLDEISEIDVKLQAKLLRAIQEREIDRIGGSKPIKLDLRIIATSNRDLIKEVKENRFREDLYFRLNIINIKLPPLKNRGDDIILFAEYFIKKYSISNNIKVKPLSNSAKIILLQHDWRGNIRELENTIYRAVLMSNNDDIRDTDLLLDSFNDKETNNMIGKTVDSVEKELITMTLDHCLGNRTHAANILGISIRTLRNKLNQYSKST